MILNYVNTFSLTNIIITLALILTHTRPPLINHYPVSPSLVEAKQNVNTNEITPSADNEEHEHEKEDDHKKPFNWKDILTGKGPLPFVGDDPMLDLLNKNTSEIIRHRGYNAEDHFVITEDGYILNVIRATNPLINDGSRGHLNRSVVLFVHGALTNAKCYVVHSSGAKPRDFSKHQASEMSLDELDKLLEGGGSSNSLVFTMLDFGHEVWLLNRRGNTYSQGHVNPKQQAHVKLKSNNGTLAGLLHRLQDAFEGVVSGEFNDTDVEAAPPPPATMSKGPSKLLPAFASKLIGKLPNPVTMLKETDLVPNPKYWDFSMDEQARYDLPAVVDYILRQTNRTKLAYVGHSVGGALMLEALSTNPVLNEKFSKILIWAPAFDLDGNKRKSLVLSFGFLFLAPMRLYAGDVPPRMLVPLMQDLVGDFCSNKLTTSTICNPFYEILYGPGAEDNYLVGGVSSAFPDSMSSHELAQLAQFTTKDSRSSMFDFGSREKNFAKYGQIVAPRYNLSAITTDRLKVYYSDTDFVVPVIGVRRLLADLRTPYEWFVFEEDKCKFNHQAYMVHRNITRLLVIPSLRDIQAAGL